MIQEKICKEVSQTPAAFTILFGETTTLQVRKQMAIWLDIGLKDKVLL